MLSLAHMGVAMTCTKEDQDGSQRLEGALLCEDAQRWGRPEGMSWPQACQSFWVLPELMQGARAPLACVYACKEVPAGEGVEGL